MTSEGETVGTRRFNLAMEACLVVFWSSGFIGAVLASRSGASVFLVLFWRFVIASLCLLPFALAAARTVPWREFAVQASIGLLAMAGFIGFITVAIDLGVPAGTAALVTALQPLATAALVGPLLGVRLRGIQWIGLLAGLAGVGLAVNGSLGDAPRYAYALPFISVACVVLATILSKARPAVLLPLPATICVQSLATALAMLPFAALTGSVMPPAEAAFWAAVAWFVILCTFAAYGFYWLCLARSSATRVASLMYLTPPVTAIWAWALFGQPLTWWVAAGFALCLLGVWIAHDPSALES